MYHHRLKCLHLRPLILIEVRWSVLQTRLELLHYLISVTCPSTHTICVHSLSSRLFLHKSWGRTNILRNIVGHRREYTVERAWCMRGCSCQLLLLAHAMWGCGGREPASTGLSFHHYWSLTAPIVCGAGESRDISCLPWRRLSIVIFSMFYWVSTIVHRLRSS
jgi:hypothetical protein